MENTEHPLMPPNVIFMNFSEQEDALSFKAGCKLINSAPKQAMVTLPHLKKIDPKPHVGPKGPQTKATTHPFLPSKEMFLRKVYNRKKEEKAEKKKREEKEEKGKNLQVEILL